MEYKTYKYNKLYENLWLLFPAISNKCSYQRFEKLELK